MRKIIALILIAVCLSVPVQALELTAPTVPREASNFMPSEPQNLREAIMQILKEAVSQFRPDLREASKVCLGICAAVMVTSVINTVPAGTSKATELAGTVAISCIFLSSAGALIRLGADTVTEVSEYGKLLLPVLTTALAAQGGAATSAALYAGTAMFDSVLSGVINRLLIPLVYVYLALSISHSAVGEELLKNLRDGTKWLMTWLLKIILYVFTGFISITGVVSGTTDAAALKAAKLTISGFVPVVGGILSDASEAVLVSAGTVKNSIGIYGMFAVLALWMEPFLKIGSHYLLLRLTGAACSVFGSKRATELIHDFATAMGFLLAMTGAVCMMLLISTVCYMKGVS